MFHNCVNCFQGNDIASCTIKGCLNFTTQALTVKVFIRFRKQTALKKCRHKIKKRNDVFTSACIFPGDHKYDSSGKSYVNFGHQHGARALHTMRTLHIVRQWQCPLCYVHCPECPVSSVFRSRAASGTDDTGHTVRSKGIPRP